MFSLHIHAFLYLTFAFEEIDSLSVSTLYESLQLRIEKGSGRLFSRLNSISSNKLAKHGDVSVYVDQVCIIVAYESSFRKSGMKSERDCPFPGLWPRH